MHEGGRADSSESLDKQRYNFIVKPPEQTLTGEQRSTYIEAFIAEDRLSTYPADLAVTFDENMGATYTGQVLDDLTEEVERAYEIFPSSSLPLARVVATDLLYSVHSDELCVLAKLPAEKIDVDLLLAHLEAAGHGLEPALSASIARRAMLALLNNGGGIRTTDSVMTREQPEQLADGRWRIGSYQDTSSRRPTVLAMDRSEDGGGKRPTPQLEDGGHQGRGTSGGGGVKSSEAKVEVEAHGAARPEVRGKLMLKEDLNFGAAESIVKGTVLDWMVPTPFERRQLDEDYQADRERMGSYARPWVVVDYGGKRRRIPGSAVRRL